jgi:hypothetical protein
MLAGALAFPATARTTCFETERKGIDALAPAVAFDAKVSAFRRS